MANKSIAMNKLRSIIRLHNEGKNKSFISRYLGFSRNTVHKYVEQLQRLGLTYDNIKNISDLELYQCFELDFQREVPDRLKSLRAFFPYVQKELRKTGVNSFYV